MGSHPVKSAPFVSFKNIWCCAESQHFCAKSKCVAVCAGGWDFSEGQTQYAHPCPISSSQLAQDVRPGQLLPRQQRMPVETWPLAKAPGLHSDPGPGSKWQGHAKFCRSRSSGYLSCKISGLLSGKRTSISEGPSQQQSPGN